MQVCWNQLQFAMLHCGRFVNPAVQWQPPKEEIMSKPLSLSAHVSTALMVLFALAMATGDARIEHGSGQSGAAPLIGLTVGG